MDSSLHLCFQFCRIEVSCLLCHLSLVRMNIEYVVVSTNIIVLIGNLFCLIVLKYAWCFASQKLLPLKICDLALESAQ